MRFTLNTFMTVISLLAWIMAIIQMDHPLEGIGWSFIVLAMLIALVGLTRSPKTGGIDLENDKVLKAIEPTVVIGLWVFFISFVLGLIAFFLFLLASLLYS